MGNFIPLKVTFWLDRPMSVPLDPIHLDALLAYARVEEAKVEAQAGGQSMTNWDIQHDLPVQFDERAQAFMASQLVFAPKSGIMTASIIRKTSIDAWAHDKGVVYKANMNSVNPGSGRYKSYFVLNQTQWVEKATSWCVGDPERIRELLDHIKFIGKLGRNGAGAVCKIEIEPDPTAVQKSCWRALAKIDHLPPAIGRHYSKCVGRTISPYWSSEKHEIYVPTSLFCDAFETEKTSEAA